MGPWDIIDGPDVISNNKIVITISFHLRHCAVRNMYVVICGKLYLYLSHLPTYCIAIELDFYVTFIPPHDKFRGGGRSKNLVGQLLKGCLSVFIVLLLFSIPTKSGEAMTPFPPTSATPDR